MYTHQSLTLILRFILIKRFYVNKTELIGYMQNVLSEGL